MPDMPVPKETIRAAQAARHDSQKRFAAGDRSVTSEELTAFGNLLTAIKLAGIRDPMGTLVERAMPSNISHWRHDLGPLSGGRQIV